jgi:CubicO group peptidase (beta-lactamase class C family)
MDIALPESMGFSSARLARIRPVMQRYVDERKLAGIQSLISRHGKVVHFESVGMADMGKSAPMSEGAIFRIYSMTKPITSVAVLMLMEESLLRIGDPISAYIPAFKEMKVLDYTPGSAGKQIPAVREITIHDLLTHTSGLSYGFEEDALIDQMYGQHIWSQMEQHPDWTLADWIGEVTKLPLAYQPGTRYRYSMATDVLGYLVQVVSGMPFDQFLAERIFKPLGMPDTGFHVPPARLERFAACYQPCPENGLKAFEPGNYYQPPAAPSGGGGLVSTTADYFRFCRMLLNKGELDSARLLGRKTVEWMTVNHLPPGIYLNNDPNCGVGFGLGVSVTLDPGRQMTLESVGTYGWGGAANTNFWIDPREGVVGILMLQYMPSETYPVVADFRNLAYQAMVD